MGQHGLPSVLRAADLEHDQRLAPLPRAGRHRAELVGPTEALHEDADDGGVLVVDEELHVVLDAHAGLVAAGDDVAEPHRALAHEMLGDGVAEAAALRDDGHAARPHLGQVRAERGHAQPDVEHAIAVGPADEQPALGGQPLERGLPLAPDRARFGEAARQHDGGPHAAVDGGGEDAGHLLGGDGHHDAVGRLRRRGLVGIARQAEHLVVLGIVREVPSAIAERFQIFDDAGRPTHALRGADDGDAARPHQRGEVESIAHAARSAWRRSTRPASAPV